MTLHLRAIYSTDRDRADVVAARRDGTAERLRGEPEETRALLRWPLPVNLNARGAS